MRKILSKNPYNSKIIKEFNFLTDFELKEKLEDSRKAFKSHRKYDSNQKKGKISNVAKILEKNKLKYAEIITAEMGKPIKQSLAEIKKCTDHCNYYVQNMDKFIAPTLLKKSKGQKILSTYEPTGTIFIISPFNNPFWINLRCSIPNLLLGNTILARTSDSTPLVGLAIEELFQAAGFDNNEVINVFSDKNQTEMIISDSNIQGVCFTGSDKSGESIAQIAGKYIKKSVLELGGSDPVLICKDANLDLAVDICFRTRILNAGQICCAGKRFLVDETIYDDFMEKLVERMKNVIIGDPFEEKTILGPLAREDLLINVGNQVDKAISQGAKLILGGKRLYNDPSNGYFFPPTILELEDSKNVAFSEEIFGPVFSVKKTFSEEEMLDIANDSNYGLGAIVVSIDNDRAQGLANSIDTGNVFINEVTNTFSEMPFGGIKRSGYGRELGIYGFREFANIKTIFNQK